MRRSGFKRKVYAPPPSPPLRPSTVRAVMVPANDGVFATPKGVYVRSRAYREWVASHPCFGCGIEKHSQAAHENFGKGMGLKVCDTRCFPLCAPHLGLPGCHFLYDHCVDMTRDEAREQGRAYVERMQRIAIAAGRMTSARELIP